MRFQFSVSVRWISISKWNSIWEVLELSHPKAEALDQTASVWDNFNVLFEFHFAKGQLCTEPFLPKPLSCETPPITVPNSRGFCDKLLFHPAREAAAGGGVRSVKHKKVLINSPRFWWWKKLAQLDGNRGRASVCDAGCASGGDQQSSHWIFFDLPAKQLLLPRFGDRGICRFLPSVARPCGPVDWILEFLTDY